MRLKSSIFISALIRKLGNEGAFCSVLNKGAQEAGAIFIYHNNLEIIAIFTDLFRNLYYPNIINMIVISNC